MNKPQTSSAEFFEEKYRRTPDPWNFASSPYELFRYDRIIRALEGRCFQNAFEPGCSVGVLTERLAEWTGHLLAVDLSSSASAQASLRCSRYPGVEVQTASLRSGLARGGYDLIVLSEIGYYFTAPEWSSIARSLVGAMRTPAVLLAAHWLGESEDHVLSGDAVHDLLRAHVGLPLEHAERHAGFRLERWVHP